MLPPDTPDHDAGYLRVENQAAFEAGMSEYRDAAPLSDNPYPEPPENDEKRSQFHFWRMGWKTARWLAQPDRKG